MARLLEIPIKADLIKKSTNTYSINADSTGVYFKIDILKNGEKFDLTDKTVRAYMLKKDKKVIYIDCTLENNNDEIECFLDVTTQMLNAEYLTVQFLITDTEGSTVVTNPVYIAIGDTVIDTEAIESSSEFSALQEALLKVNNLSSNASPLMANTVADMTDSTRCYVYTGTEEGYSKGYLYYWNGTAWTKGWLYQSEKANAVDVTMADGTDLESTIGSLKEDLVNVNNLVSPNYLTPYNIRKGKVTYTNNEKIMMETESQKYNNNIYNVEGYNSIYISIDTVDRSYSGSTNLSYAIFTNTKEISEKSTAIAEALICSSVINYRDVLLKVPDGAKYLFLTYSSSGIDAIVKSDLGNIVKFDKEINYIQDFFFFFSKKSM